MSDWTDEEKETAIQLYHDYGASVAAKFAGTSRQSIYTWIRQAERAAESARLRVEEPSLWAHQVKVGDTILWCGRQVQILDIELTNKRQGKAGRWFTGLVDGSKLSLHWFDTERVRVPAPVIAGSSQP